MANLLADAQNNLRNWQNTYQTVRVNHERLDAVTEEAAREGENDENGQVNPAAILVSRDHARMSGALDASLLATLRTFGDEIKMPRDSQRNNLLDELIAYMGTDREDIQIKSRGTVYGSPAADGGNTGNAVLFVCSKDANDHVIESATIETLTFECLGASANRSGLGLESYSVRGEGKSTRSEFTAGGTGTRLVGTTAIGPGRSGIVQNPSFDLPFRGSGTEKIQGWDFESGEGNVARDATVVAENRGEGNHASLKCTGNFVLRFYFRKRGVPLSYLAPIIAGLRWRADGSAGDLDITLGSSGNTSYTNTVATSNQATFQTLMIDPDDTNAWRRNFDTNGNPYLEIKVTNYTSGNIWIDDLIADYMDSLAGRPSRIVSGVTPAIKGDKFTHTCSLDVGQGSVELASGASGSLNGITVNGVELLSETILFAVSLAATAQAAVDNINSHRTFPNYIASRSTTFILITQEIPVEGTLTVSSDATIIGTNDTNVTGASLGKIQDSIVRRTGKYLPHGTADSGWEDHA